MSQVLHLIDEGVPYKLSQQVPLWNVDDLSAWALLNMKKISSIL